MGIGRWEGKRKRWKIIRRKVRMEVGKRKIGEKSRGLKIKKGERRDGRVDREKESVRKSRREERVEERGR